MARIEGAASDTRILPNGDRLDVLPMMFGNGRLTFTFADNRFYKETYDGCWCYDSVARALEEQASWDGVGEPTGWKREPSSGRRRPDGDPAQEYMQP